MAEVTITGLPNASTLTGAERVPMDQAGATVDASAQAIADLATAATVGLGNVNNTSDASKPISTATQTALDLKAAASAISNINNTSDLAKPISTATQAALDLKAAASHTQAASTITGLAAVATSGVYTDLSGRPSLAAVATTGSASDLTIGTLPAERIPATAVTAGSYGSASLVPVLTVGADGRITTAGTTAVSGGAADLSYTASTRLLESSTGTDVTLPLVASTTAGLAPASGGGTATFLRADGTWSTAGSPPGGSTTQLQFNDAGAFAGDVDLTWNKTTNVLGIAGDVLLSDGGAFTATLQTITATAARTISFPDATGTVALVAGSSEQLIYNNAGAYAGASTLTYDGSILTSNGRFINSYNATASSPAKAFTGTWFTGGTATTTKPQVLIEPTGATSTAWSTSGTGLGVNASSGFAGNLLDLQVNGTSQFRVTSNGGLVFPASSATRITLRGVDTNTLGINLTDVGEFYRFGSSTGFFVAGFCAIGWAAGGLTSSGLYDLTLFRDAANTLAQRNGTNAQTFRCYGTFTDASNYVRAALSSTSTAVTLAAETAGTGADNIPLNLTAAGTGTIKVNSVAEVVVSSTVAGLPAAPVVGMLTRVTDATAPVVGTTVAGGGAAAALCWYNGANWSVIGV